MKNIAIALMLLGGTLLMVPAFAEEAADPGKDTVKACASDHACCEQMKNGDGCCCCCKGGDEK